MDELSEGAPLTISVTDTEDGPLITAAGELDASNVHRLRSVVDSHLGDDGGPVMFEFAGVTFMDTSALALLIQTSKKVGASLRVLRPSDQVRAVIEITGLAGILVMEP